MHGGARDDRLAIAIELERNGATLIARIDDTGCEFDPTQFPHGEVARGRESRRLWHPPDALLCDRYAYERQQGRNGLTLRFAGPH
jgi:hypothetical protein